MIVAADAGTWLHGLAGRSSTADSLLTFAASSLPYAVVLVVLGLWLRRDGLRAVIAAGVGALLGLAVGSLLGALWQEQRPFVADHYAPLIAHSADASFPSDHLTVIGAAFGAAWPVSRTLAAAAAVLGLVVGFARVAVGVHYPWDVVAGFALGAAGALVAWAVLGLLPEPLGRLDALLRRLHLRPGVSVLRERG